MRLRVSLLIFLFVAGPTGLALAAGGQPKHAFTPAGQAVAKKVVLVRADLPGFTAKASTSNTGTTPSCPGFKPDQSDLTEIGRAESPDLTGPSGIPFITSEAAVFVSSKQAKASFDRILRPGLTQCLSSFITKSAPKGMTFAVTSQRLDTVHGLGDQASTATLAMRATQGTTVLRFVVEFHAVRKGAVDGLLLVVNLGGPYAGAGALVQKLVSRMP